MIYDYLYNNKKDINDIIRSKDKINIILYYSNSCWYCTQLMPVWNRIKKKYLNDNNINIIGVERDNIKHMLKKYKGNVFGFPTIIKIKEGNIVGNYEGDRRFKSLNIFIKK